MTREQPMEGRFTSLFVWLGLVLTLAAVIHISFVVLYPYAIVALLGEHLKAKVGINRFYHASRPDSDSREVVRPSPDLLYSIGAFDLSHGPLEVVSSPPGTYMSLSLYSANGDNFFVVNDRALTNGPLKVVLVGGNQDVPPGSDRSAIRSPSKSGIMLLRYFAGGKEAIADRMRRDTQCKPVQ
jgi:uncharacterized membrane protein